MWASRQPPEKHVQWLRKTVSDDISEDRVALAVQLNRDIFQTLLEFACADDFEYRLRSLEWSLIIARDEPGLDDGANRSLAAAGLNAAGRSAAPQRNDSDGFSNALRQRKKIGAARSSNSWYWIYLLLRYILAQRPDTSFIEWDSIDVSEDERLLLNCFLMLGGKDTGDTFTEMERALVVRCMSKIPPDSPRSERVTSTRKSRRAPYNLGSMDEPRLLAGYVEVAQEVIAKYDALDAELTSRCWSIARSSTQDAYTRLASALLGAGYKDPHPWDLLPAFKKLLEQIPGDAFDRWRIALQASAELAETDAELSPSDAWRLPQLSALFDASELPSMTLRDFVRMQDLDVAFLASWFLALSHAYEIDPVSVGVEARHLLREPNGHGDEALDALLLTSPVRGKEPDLTLLTKDDLSVLSRGLESEVDLVSQHAVHLLASARNAALGAELESRIGSMRPHARYLTNIVICASAGADASTVVQKHLESEDLHRQRSAAWFAKVAVKEDESIGPILQSALCHPDMTVRASAGADQELLESASYWTCNDCLQRNELNELDCLHCDTGARPGKHPS